MQKRVNVEKSECVDYDVIESTFTLCIEHAHKPFHSSDFFLNWPQNMLRTEIESKKCGWM